MTPDIKLLYQELILDHSRNPRNVAKLRKISHEGHGDNPLCGDKIDVFINLESDRLVEISFKGAGCAITTASASMMTQEVKGKSKAEINKLVLDFLAMLRNGAQKGALDSPNTLPEKLQVFEGVKQFPGRVKCAGLAWHALANALQLKVAAIEDSSA